MDNEELIDLINRLLCRYPIGPIDPSTGEPEFGWRDYSGPAPEDMVIPSPLMIEAVGAIQKLGRDLEHWQAISRSRASAVADLSNQLAKACEEREALAVKLKELEGQEPVAVVCDTYELRWIGCGPIAPIIGRHQIKVGDSLYARPVSAEPVNARLLKAVRNLLSWIDDYAETSDPCFPAIEKQAVGALAAAESNEVIPVSLSDGQMINLFQIYSGLIDAGHTGGYAVQKVVLEAEKMSLRANGFNVED